MTRRRYPGRDQDTAAAVLSAAALLMPDYGYARVTVRDIARQAGVGLGTVYGHFSGKEEIGVELVSRGVEAVFTRLQALLDANLPPGERLRGVLASRVTARLDLGRGQRHPVNEGTRELAAALAPHLDGWRRAEYAMVTDCLLKGYGSGAQDAASPQILARGLVWAMDGMVAEALLPAGERPPLVRLSYTPRPGEASGGIMGSGEASGGIMGSGEASGGIMGSGEASGDTRSDPAEALAGKAALVADLLVAGVEARWPWTAG